MSAHAMSYQDVLRRNVIAGGIINDNLPPVEHAKNLIARDLRQMEKDQRDVVHLNAYANLAQVSPERVKIILDAFFDSSIEPVMLCSSCKTSIRSDTKETEVPDLCGRCAVRLGVCPWCSKSSNSVVGCKDTYWCESCEDRYNIDFDSGIIR